MPPSEKTGLFFTDEKIVLAESTSKKSPKLVSSSITASLDPSKDVPFHSDITEEIHIVSTFQRLVRENNIDLSQVCVSIPVKEVFLRSFTLPVMPASELNNVIFYEAKKYIPIDLKLLDYVYHAVPFVQDKQKGLRIIFYAVRKQTIEKYDRILKQAGGKAVLYEPSPVSLAKQLIAQNHLKLDQKITVLYTQRNYGQIIFYEKGISYFIREFVLSGHDGQLSKTDPALIREQLLIEVKKSIEYYIRQFSSEKVKEVLLLNSSEDKDLSNALAEALAVKVRVVEPVVMGGVQKHEGLDVLCASGSCVPKPASVFSLFNFMLSKSAPQSKVDSKANVAIMGQFLNWKTGDFLYAIQASLVCLFLLGVGFIFSQQKLGGMKKQVEGVLNLQAEGANKTIEIINSEINNNKAQIEGYKKMLDDRSHIASTLVGLTQSFSDGVWLENLELHSVAGGGMSVDFKGYVYLSDAGAEFKSVSQLLTRLEGDAKFSSIKFKVNSRQRKQINGNDVVSFSITGI